MAIFAPARSRRTQARFARFKNETKSRQALSQAAGLQGSRCLARPPADIFQFSATFAWALVRALSQPMGKVAQKGAKGGSETLFAQSRVLGRTRAADADFDRIFAISRDAGSPAPKTCQLSAKPIGKVRGRGLDPAILARKKALGALKPHQALSLGLALPRKQPRRKRCATRIFEILTPSWSAKIAKIAKSNEISMIWPFPTPARSRRTQARFARFNNETKSRQELSQAAGLQGARCLARPPAENFHFRPLFPGPWSGAFAGLWEGWLKRRERTFGKTFRPKPRSRANSGR